MHFKVSPKSVFVLSNVIKRALASHESAKSALLLSKVLTQQKHGWSLILQVKVRERVSSEVLYCKIPCILSVNGLENRWYL